MKVEYYKEYSPSLNREMEFKMYGHDGMLCLVIPCQDGRFFEWEDRGMFNLVSDLIDQGRVQFVTADTIDKETWSSYENSDTRMGKEEAWIHYLVDELIPSAKAKAGYGADSPVMVMGASMGASHAANLFFRFPDLFSKMLVFSGIYDFSPYIYDGNYNYNFYQNSPISYLSNMPADHPFVKKYNDNQAVFVVGQGAWENECLNDTRRLQQVCNERGIYPTFMYWGYDTPHDWPSWEKQLREYLPQMV